ncbi:SGNH/GDSL hydrolase family protein [Streptomyces daliensis]
MSERRSPRLRSPLRRRISRLAALPLAAALVGTALSASSAATAVAAQPSADGRYVALGDSFTAGPGIADQDPDSGLCARSDKNYPSLLAAGTGVSSFTDVSCSGAVTGSMTASQFGKPPQFDALRADDELVTLGIGGNDAGFAGIIATCVLLAAFDPEGAPCEKHYTSGGTDQLEEDILAVEPKIAATLKGIHERAPKAHVVVVGYPVILPESRTECAPDNPNRNAVAEGDAPYLNEKHRLLNTVIARQAEANGATFVDTYRPSLGHDACQAPGDRWMEGIWDVRNGAPVHPNGLGMRAMADAVLAALDGEAP